MVQKIYKLKKNKKTTELKIYILLYNKLKKKEKFLYFSVFSGGEAIQIIYMLTLRIFFSMLFMLLTLYTELPSPYTLYQRAS